MKRVQRPAPASPLRPGLALTGVLLAAVLALPPSAGAEPYRTLMKRGTRYYRMELFRESAHNFQQARQKHSTLESYFNTGAALYKESRYQQAIESFSTALSFTDKPDELADIHYNLGNSFFKLADYKQAAAHYREGLDQDPGDLNMKYNLELALRNLKKQQSREDSDGEGPGGGMGPEKSDGTEPDAGKSGDQGGRDAGSGTAGKQEQSPGPKKGSSEPGTQESGQLGADEARTLINAVNSDQDKVMREIIRRKTGADEQETGW